jgi:hypothetical protein
MFFLQRKEKTVNMWNQYLARTSSDEPDQNIFLKCIGIHVVVNIPSEGKFYVSLII